jgi:hypothetical protein
MNPSLKDTQKYLMKKIDKYTTKIHYIMLILDIISQIIEQEEPINDIEDEPELKVKSRPRAKPKTKPVAPCEQGLSPQRGKIVEEPKEEPKEESTSNNKVKKVVELVKCP